MLHVSRLPRHGVEVVAVVGPGDAIRGALADAGVDDYVFLDRMCHEPHYPIEGLRGSLAFGARFASDWLLTQRALLGLARARRIDVILANRAPGWIAASAVSRALRIPMVWRGGSRLTRAVEVRALRALAPLFRPALFLANCEAIRAQFSAVLRAPCAILRNGVDTDRFDPQRARRDLRAALRIDAAVPLVGMSARPAPEKGMERLLSIVQETARGLPGVRFCIAGEFGFRQRYERDFAQAGLGDRVRFLGHVQDIPAFLLACDAVVLTSNAHSIEGSPNALLEAMAMGRPVVATRVGGVAEAVTHGVDGFLFDEDDVRGFASHLLQLLRDQALRERMGAAGRARILRDFQVDQVVADLAQRLREVQASSGRRR